MMVRDYYVEIDKLSAEEGGGWIARVPDLPGCLSDAADLADLRDGIADAIDTWVATATRMGRVVPRPAQVDERRA